MLYVLALAPIHRNADSRPFERRIEQCLVEAPSRFWVFAPPGTQSIPRGQRPCKTRRVDRVHPRSLLRASSLKHALDLLFAKGHLLVLGVTQPRWFDNRWRQTPTLVKRRCSFHLHNSWFVFDIACKTPAMNEHQHRSIGGCRIRGVHIQFERYGKRSVACSIMSEAPRHR